MSTRLHAGLLSLRMRVRVRVYFFVVQSNSRRGVYRGHILVNVRVHVCILAFGLAVDCRQPSFSYSKEGPTASCIDGNTCHSIAVSHEKLGTKQTCDHVKVSVRRIHG